MDAKFGCGADFFQEPADRIQYIRHFLGECAPVRVAENNCARTSFDRSFQGRQSIIRIVFETIKKMFGIIYQIIYIFSQIGEGIFDYDQVLPEFDIQGVRDMDIPTLAEDSNNWCFCLNECLQIFILLSIIADMTG